MLTLSANLSAYLQKTSNPELCYLVKLSAQNASSYANIAFYFSDIEMTVTDSTSQRVRGILLNSSIDITQVVDVKNHKASFGGFSLKLADELPNAFSDELSNYRIYNRSIEIYIGDPSESTLSNYLKIYTGIAKDWIIYGGVITINIENSSGIYSKDIPSLFTSLSYTDYTAAIAESDNKINPVIYGDHKMLYGKDDASLSNIDDMYSQKNNDLVKPLFIGLDSAGDYVYVLASHELNSTDATNYRAWLFDKRLNRFVMLPGATFFEISDYTYLIIDSDETARDWWFPDGTTSAASETNGGSWSDKANSCDKDYDTYAQSYYDYNNDFGTANYSIDFVPYDGYQEDSDISTVRVWVKAEYEEIGTAPDFTFTINSTSAEGTNAVELEQMGTNTASKTGINNSVAIVHNNNSDTYTDEESTAKLYMIFKEIDYTITDISEHDIYVACKGKEADVTVAGIFSGLSSGDMIEHPAHILADVLINLIGVTSYDSDALTTMESRLTSHKMCFHLRDQINSLTFLQKFGKQCNSIIYWNADDQASVFTFTDSYTTDKTLKLNDLAGLPAMSTTSLSDIVNDLKLDYRREGKSGSLQETDENADDRANIGSQDVYNAVSQMTMNADLICDTTTADDVANHWCKNDDDSFWSVLHDVIEFETSDLRGGGSLYDSGTFEPLIRLELLDVIELDDGDFDSFIKCNGKSWSGIQFLIVEITQTRMNLKIKAISV